MNSFEQCQSFERRVFEEYQRDFFARKSHSGIVTVEKGRHSRKLQLTLGDLAYNRRGSKEMLFIECKAERSYTGNLFLEGWSNRSRGALGWMFNNDADWLSYFFMAHEVMYLIDQPKLKRWALPSPHGEGNMERFRLAPQSKHDQLNDTWGHLVPVEVVAEEVGLFEYRGKPLRPVTFEGALPRQKWSESSQETSCLQK